MSRAVLVSTGQAEISQVSVGAARRVAFLDNLRYLMIVLVVLHHAVAAYASVAPHWVVHDTAVFAADLVRELLDVFTMPVLFFIAGYFALSSLEKHGVRDFLADKAKRLLIPWALFVLAIIPLLMYSKADHPIRPFWSYWLWYLGSFETRLRFTQASDGPTTQAVYWFVSLLFAFLAVFALVHTLIRRLGSSARLPATRVREATPGNSALVMLLLFGVVVSASHFASLLLVPDTSWLTLSALLEFQVTRLVPYAGCFALGVYAQSRGWLGAGKPLGSIPRWGAISAVLAVAYLVIGQPIFANTAGAPSLPVGILLAFAVSRSFLMVSLLVVLFSAGARYWDRSTGLDRQLSATSYNIYLVHYWVVIVIQEALLEWTGGPVLVKVALVFAAALALSFALSRWVVGRYPRVVTAAVLGLLVFCLVVRP